MSFAPERFHRHAFVWLDDGLMPRLSDAHPDVVLRGWLGEGRPLIVRRPCLSPDGENVCAGLALPPDPHKRRLAFDLPRVFVREVAEPPLWEDCEADIANGTVEQIRAAAGAGGVPLRTFGSHAWQHLTGLPYVTKNSDIDVLAFINTRKSWRVIRQELEWIDWSSAPEIDLEIVLGHDASFSWREFSNTSARLLFKGNSRVWPGFKHDADSHISD